MSKFIVDAKILVLIATAGWQDARPIGVSLLHMYEALACRKLDQGWRRPTLIRR
jgi:hypothetical protein